MDGTTTPEELTESITLSTNGYSSAQISLYPNPSTGTVNIITAEVATSVVVINSLGQTVQEFTPSNTDVQLQLTDRGMYHVQLVFGNTVVVKEVIIK